MPNPQPARPDRVLTFGVMLLALTGLVAGCRGAETKTLPPQRAASKVAAIAADPVDSRMYFVGLAFHDLRLAGIQPPNSHGMAYAIYGTCRMARFDSEPSCSPPVQVSTQIWSVDWPAVRGCTRIASRWGVPTVFFGDAVGLFTGDPLVLIKVIAPNDELTGVIRALRPVGGARPRPSGGRLAPPSATERANIDRVCGARPGEPGSGSRDI
jgi:hypothetical protein